MFRMISIIGWDGAMPLLVAFTPSLIRAFFPVGHIAEVAAAITLPISLALVRAQVGSSQLHRLKCVSSIWRRQLAMGAAIVLLLVFEICVMFLHFAKDEPDSAWIVAVVLFLSYLSLIWLALRPFPHSENQSGGVIR